MSKEAPIVKILTDVWEFISKEELSALKMKSKEKDFTFKTVTSELPYRWELYGCTEEITLDTTKVKVYGFSEIDSLERKVPVLETLLKENEDVKTIADIIKPEVVTSLKREIKTQIQSDIKWDFVENLRDSLREEAYKELREEFTQPVENTEEA